MTVKFSPEDTIEWVPGGSVATILSGWYGEGPFKVVVCRLANPGKLHTHEVSIKPAIGGDVLRMPDRELAWFPSILFKLVQ